jgi:cytochrome d ubiquinol oxidase subunit I
MAAIGLSRLQFALTAMFHFIFVPLTLGLVWLVARWEWKFVRTGDEMYVRMAKYWGKLFLVNFVLGVVTGITLEFQFGMNWAEYSKYVGDIFGAPLAIEAIAAFFLESTFIGLWVFGWKKLSKKIHAASITLVAFGTALSALWICLANGWMQHPVGYALRNGRAEMTDFGAVATNGTGWLIFGHTLLAGFVTAGFFVMGVSAWHLLRKNEVPLFKASFKTATVFALAASVLVAVTGDQQGVQVAKYQPAKLAAMESHWETRAGAPYTIFSWPDRTNEKNAFEFLKIPKGLSLMGFHKGSAEVKGLRDIPPEERPPVLPVFLSFKFMVASGFFMIFAAFLGWRKCRRDKLESSPKFLRLLVWLIPLPYIVIQFGWVVTELGRQPWLVYGLMRTSEGASTSLVPSQVLLSLILFTLVYGTLGVVDIYLLAKYSRRGPAKAPAVAAASDKERGRP